MLEQRPREEVSSELQAQPREESEPQGASERHQVLRGMITGYIMNGSVDTLVDETIILSFIDRHPETRPDAEDVVRRLFVALGTEVKQRGNHSSSYMGAFTRVARLQRALGGTREPFERSNNTPDYKPGL